MESRVKVLGHPVHQALIPLPLGMLSASVAFDTVHRLSGKASWRSAADATLGAGLLGGLVAAPFGVVDWLAIPAGTRAKRIGLFHGVTNVVVVLLFSAVWLARSALPDFAPSDLLLAIEGGMLWLAIVGIVCAVIGCFYYLRVVKVMYFDEPPQGVPEPRQDKPLRWMLGVNSLALVALGLSWNPIMAWCQKAFM